MEITLLHGHIHPPGCSCLAKLITCFRIYIPFPSPTNPLVFLIPTALSMEYVLRCNDLKCRSQLHERAVVTTCSHIFCTNCADTTGLSRSKNAQRVCPACNAPLPNPDDVVIAGLNPSEDYKTSVLSGLSPTVIMECASRGLAFHSYQTSQEIIYQEHLAKGLTEKYNTLSQQMDQLIHDANAQIKALQDKMQAMQADLVELESKNHGFAEAFKEKTKAHQRTQNLYQALKAQVMASHVAHAAGDEAEFALKSAWGDRFIDRLPGARSGTANFSQTGPSQQTGGRLHQRIISRSSGSSGQQQQSSIHVGPPFNSQLHGRSLGSRVHSRQYDSVDTPSQARRSHLPVLGGTRQNPYLNQEPTSSFQNSPMIRQPMAGGFSHSGKSSRRTGNFANTSPLGP